MFLKIFAISLLLHFSAAVSNKYIDLSDLPEYDDFLGDALDNVYHNDGGETRLHYLRKRQTNQNELLRENKAFGDCRTPRGEAGQCRHIVYCRIEELQNNIWNVVSQLCIIENKSIGICCPEGYNAQLAPQVLSTIDSNESTLSHTVNRPESRGCGISTKQFSRIPSVSQVDSDEWPWMAAILLPDLPYVHCGGVLINDRLVLTAAHCIEKHSKDVLMVRLGEYHTRQLNETRSRDFRISNMLMHIDYDPLTYENDIALVRIVHSTLFNSYIWPVCMPPLNKNWEGSIGTVTGWGLQDNGGPYSDVLMEVPVPVWKQHDCRAANVERISDTMLCAGLPEGGQDSCQGDSGGPLLVQLPNKRWVTIGIVSWGILCGIENKPGIYTRVDKYYQWIFDNSGI